ncbi:MAG: hypothetical protein KAV45_01220 [Calditrichia bacterium]|nr:hypothetical protein [Calditrichia bacterium]
MKAIRLIEYKKLVVKEVNPSQVMEAFQLLENEPENYLKILIKLSD